MYIRDAVGEIHYFKFSKMSETPKKRKASTAAPKKPSKKKAVRVPRFKSVVKELFDVYEVEDKSDENRMAFNYRFDSRYETDLIAQSRYGLSRGQESGKIYIKLQENKDKNYTLEYYLSNVDRYTEQAFSFIKDEVLKQFGLKLEDVTVIYLGGLLEHENKFGTFKETPFFPGKFTKYYSITGTSTEALECKPGKLIEQTGNSDFILNMSANVVNIVYKKDEKTIELRPYFNVDGLTWINIGQDTNVINEEAEEAKKKRKSDIVRLFKQFQSESKETKSTDIQYNTEDDEHPESVLPSPGKTDVILEQMKVATSLHGITNKRGRPVKKAKKGK